MTRFERTDTQWIHLAIVLSMAVVFVSDLYTPLGVVTWVFYLLPIVLTFFVWRPSVPVAVAGAVTVLTLLGHVLGPAGIEPAISWLNRGFGMVTGWALAAMGYQFIRNKLAVRKQEWLQAGKTVLNQNMAGDLHLPELGDKVLHTLAEYLDAQVGAIFIDDGDRFRRFATYGLPDGAPVPESVQAGDGLLGQALRNNRLFIVDDVPAEYFVSSALGRSAPRHLLIAPLAVDGRVNSVLELGCFHRVGEAERELLVRVSPLIAIAVRSAHYRTRLQALLEETQRQAAQLQMQAEELRVSNEELEEQSRALQESQARLEQQQAELEQTNAQLEEQTSLLEQQNQELVAARNSLHAQARDLRQVSRYKSEFLANMSHELRTPLNASLILARLLAENDEGNLTPDQVKQARTIEGAGNDLLDLINDVLDLAKVEAGHMDLHPQPVVLSRLLEHLSGMFRILAEQKGLQLHLHVADDAPAMLETDFKRLEQVLRNVLSNAIKFTEQGEVTLEVGRAPDRRVTFAVHDTGIGIAEDQQQIIFEPFCQADGTMNRKHGGTGLGLSISRELVRLLGGEIQVTSLVGRGSTFSVLLPETYDPTFIRPPSAVLQSVPQMEAPPAMPSLPESRAVESRPVSTEARIEDDRAHLGGGRRVLLIVEDDQPFARILYDLAHELNFHALVATTSEEALALSVQHAPSAVLLDIGLPDHSGLSVLDRLKRDARTRHIPVHVVSNHDYMETALSLGAVGYILKPVKREQLVEAFQRLETRLLQKMRRVLIVEDDMAQQEGLRRLLGSRDVEAVGAATAAECLDQLRKTTFDCMVLDLSLPDASGFALLDTLSREDRYQFPPVIVYTGRDLSMKDEQRLRKYSKSIIIKGAKSPERLLDEVTLFLHQVVSELPVEQQAMLEKARSRNAMLDGRHILVVEDDVRNVFALTSLLEPHGVTIHIARNGREAVDVLERSSQPGAPPIDLTLMDIMMPEMDGLTATREIRKRPEWRKLPIIALTAKAMKKDQEEALAAGANDYLAKPLDVDKLLSLVRVWMPR